jgi:hypothetical protein
MSVRSWALARRVEGPIPPGNRPRVRTRLSAGATTVSGMTHDLLPDRWHDRDFPALLAAARILEGDTPEDADTQLEAFQEAAGLSERELVRALIGLEQAGFIETQGVAPLAGDPTIWVTGLTERGRRKTGLWPDEESTADALVDLLVQAAD